MKRNERTEKSTASRKNNRVSTNLLPTSTKEKAAAAAKMQWLGHATALASPACGRDQAPAAGGPRQALLDPASLPRAESPRQRPKSPRQRLYRGPETPSAKPTAPSRNVNIDVVFAESRAGRLSAKILYFFLKKSLCREPGCLALGKGVLCREPCRKALGKDHLCREPDSQTLGKELLCREPDSQALGKAVVLLNPAFYLCREPVIQALGKAGNLVLFFYFFSIFYMHSHIYIYIYHKSLCLYHNPRIYHTWNISKSTDITNPHRYDKSNITSNINHKFIT